ncbi:MAG: hypothetical protein Q9163_001869 [Psora crenata]
METTLQIHLARPEEPSEQVFDSASGAATPQARNINSSRSSSDYLLEVPERTLKGASRTTSQVKLKPKDQQRPCSVTESNLSITLLQGGEGPSYALRPIDGGFGAWSYVASAFAMYIVVWGFPQSFPIFQTYLSTGESAQHTDSVVLALLAPGLQAMEEGILFQVLPKAARHRQWIVIIGILLITSAIALASFSSTAWHKLLTQGILFGIGGIFLNFVHVSVFSEWFDKKKGQAMGIIWLGYRAGSLAFPPVCQWLLDNHGYEKTLRVLLAPMLALLLPSVLLLRGRYPASTVISAATLPKVSKMDALRSPSVVFYLFTSILFDLVTNVPMMFITKFAADIGMESSDRALALSLVFGSNIVGTYASGWLSDRGFHRGMMGASAIAASLVHFLIWGFVKTKFGVFIYAISVGLACGEVSYYDSDLFTTIHSLFSFFGGIAILSVGPVGTSLLKFSPEVEVGAYAIGKYKDITKRYLGGHLCLEIGHESRRLLGGPVRTGDDNECRIRLNSSMGTAWLSDTVAWLQTSVWFLGEREPAWSSLRQTEFRMIICLPKSHHAGTLITNFVGPFRLAQELSKSVIRRITRNHCLGRQIFGCVWILAFAILRTLTEELEFAFDMLDPIDDSRTQSLLPQLADLPVILEKSNNLARIDRYLSTLDEFVSFFIAVRQSRRIDAIQGQSDGLSRDLPSPQSSNEYATFEAFRAREKLRYEQNLCRTYMKQYDALIQVVRYRKHQAPLILPLTHLLCQVISYSTTQITKRLDAGGKVAEQFTKIGMFLAGLAAIVAPMSLLTGYYGMNVQELDPQATGTLFGFWQVGAPLLLLTTARNDLILIWYWKLIDVRAGSRCPRIGH